MRQCGARGPASIFHASLVFAGIALLCAASLVTAQGAGRSAPGLTIDQASRLAQSSSEAIRIRELAVQKSRLAVEEAGAKAWPHVDLQVSGSYLLNPPSGYTVDAGALGAIVIPSLHVDIPMPQQNFTVGAQLHDYFSVAASLTQPLFTWGKIRNAIDAAALQAEAAGTDLVSQRRDIERQVRRAYFSALLAKESETVLRRIADSAAQIVTDRLASLDQG
ncbi:MAG: TolC family protein, partial [Spirochaetia bacterium]